MFEILEHTADIGFRARARTLEGLYEAAAEALAAIALDIDLIDPRETYPLEAAGEDTESLLVNWLSEVLFLIDGRRLALRRFHVARLEPGRISAEAQGEPFDPARHRAKLVVKGITWHQLRIERDSGGWQAQVFLDI